MTNNEELLARIAELETRNDELKNVVERGKKLGIVFEKQDDDASIFMKDNIPLIIEDPARRVDPVTTGENDNPVQHSLIKGDNLHALTALIPEYKGKIDVIYTDPPYNTGGKDFIYNDTYVTKEDAYRHSKWLSFMEKRLRIAKELLSEKGVIFISIDDNEQAHLKLLMDDIFGEENFIANLIYDGGLKNTKRLVSVGHDYMLVYAYNLAYLYEEDIKWRESKKGIEAFLDFADELKSMDKTQSEKQSILKTWLRENVESLDKGLKAYSFVDDEGRVYTRGDLSAPSGNGSRYEVFHPLTGKPVKTPAGGWRYSRSSMDEKLKDNLISFGKDETTSPRFKRILSRDTNAKQVARSYFWDERSNASRMLNNLLGKDYFQFPKSVPVIKRWISLAGYKDSIVLDFFAGSGTTGHAVAELNKEDGGTRKCILITDGGKTDDGKPDIAEEITHERMKRVLTGENWADGKEHVSLEQGMDYFTVEFEPIRAKVVYDWDDEGEPIMETHDLTREDIIHSISNKTGDPVQARYIYENWKNVQKA